MFNPLYKSALTSLIFILHVSVVFAQQGWSICNTPPSESRIDDIFMVNTRIGYSVCGDGQILKTIDGGNNWNTLRKDSIYYRSVEFVNEKKGFVGGFSFDDDFKNILMKTEDGGETWNDITLDINTKARNGICGLAVADSNTIYGCGNWFQDSAYLIKSTDGGNSWDFIDMHNYAASLIDMHFINKDTGFVTGRGTAPLFTAVILYTIDGGKTWAFRYKNSIANEYCWKIQRLNEKIYFASIEDEGEVTPHILKSKDGGFTWKTHPVTSKIYNIEGIGFIDSVKGWTGGDIDNSFESDDGGLTWTSTKICPNLNRVFRVNDTLLFASGWGQIWKYTTKKDTTVIPPVETVSHASMWCYPVPSYGNFNIEISIAKQTRVVLIIYNNEGKIVKTLENSDKPQGSFTYKISTLNMSNGVYYAVLKTHEEKHSQKIVVHN